MATVTGTNRGDFLLGSTTRDGRIGDDMISGLGGDDFLYGFGGDDILLGGAGDDSYMFGVGDGTDIITDLEGLSTIYFNSTPRGSFAELTSSNFSVSGSDLVISVTVGESSQQVTLTDYYLSPSSFTILYNTAYRGSLSEVSLDDIPVRIDGSESNPFLATANADTFVGSAGFDWVSYEGSTARVMIDLSTSPADTSRNWAAGDLLTGINNLIGSDYQDSLVGNGADNILRGGAGRDGLEGGGGADRLDGGEGRDHAYYSHSSRGVRIDLSLREQIDFDGTHDFVANGNEAVGDILTNIEDIYGSDYDDWLTSDDDGKWLFGNDGNDRLEGGAGNDYLHGGDGVDTLEGGAGNDRLFGGGGGADRLEGGAGSDSLYGSNGEDTLEGGAGNDHLSGGAGADTLDGGAGHDSLNGGDGADTLDGGEGTDSASYRSSSVGVRVNLLLQGQEQIDFDGTHGFVANENEAVGDILTNIENINGSKYDDWLTGDDEDNRLYGDRGNDRLEGGAGDDVLSGGDGVDTLEGGAGNDRLLGGGGADRLEGGAGDDFLNGGRGADTLEGGAGDDRLFGDEGADTLEGGAGDDRFDGGRGNDRLDGGAGADTYYFFTGDGIDTVEDRAGDTMTLQLLSHRYEAADFVEASDNFNRNGNNLVISIDKDSEDGITDKITIVDAYDSDSNTGIGNAAFTINIEYGGAYRDSPATEITEGFWHYLT